MEKRKISSFLDSLKIKLRKVAAFVDIIDGRDIVNSTANSNLNNFRNSSNYGKSQEENAQDEIMIIHQKMDSETISAQIRKYKENDEQQIIKNRVVIFTI